jgi:chromatin remodeling complex protein RSC6
LTELRYRSKLRPVITRCGYYSGCAAQANGGAMSQTAQPGGEAMPTKSPQKKASGGKPNALQKPLQPSEELAAVVGSDPLPRGQVVSKMWEYIRSHKLQNPENRREILADNKLRKVFGKDKVTMFEMNKHLAQHLR